MPKHTLSRPRILPIFALSLLIAAAPALAQQETILFNFPSTGINGPEGLIFDSAGNLYGTAAGGSDGGAVFQLSPQSGGGWTETTLYNLGTQINAECGVTADSAGNLYGTTIGVSTGGSVYEVTPSGSGTWTGKTLHTFSRNANHGSGPYGCLLLDAAENLYGTTFYGGPFGSATTGGTVYELMPQSDGTWTQKPLHAFGNGVDGALPYAGLVFDAAGNLYGTTTQGGAYGYGTVFELVPQVGGQWKERILHNFGNKIDGQKPYAGLIFDAAGNLYGTTTQGGAAGYGTVFELIPQTGGGWKEEILHNFVNNGDGNFPNGVVLDSAGNLYGTTFYGGAQGGGVAFKLALVNGHWAEQILHSFGRTGDGSGPLAGLTLDSSGNLYGSTQGGGSGGEGTVFQIVP
jgi:uncharacterized repeat protein (TIGR03803 family)